MKPRHDKHLIYIDDKNHVWMEEHSVGAAHPDNTTYFCEIPKHEDSRWINGKPELDNVQFLTLSPFYPTIRLDVSVEINRIPKTTRYENHPAFHGCVKHMNVSALEFRKIPTHIPIAIHKIGLCYNGHKTPCKTVEVAHDSKQSAIELGAKLLNPSNVEHVVYVSYSLNDEYVNYYKHYFRKNND